MNMHYADLGQIGLHYSDMGDKEAPCVVFANSLGTDFRLWDPILPFLPNGLRIVRGILVPLPFLAKRNDLLMRGCPRTLR